MRPKQCSLRAPNLRGRERGSERGRKENRTLKKRRGEGKRRGGSPGRRCPASRPTTFLRAMQRRQPDITPTRPYVLPPSLPLHPEK